MTEKKTIAPTLPTRFNIRVYGLLIHKNRILITDEVFRCRPMTKFPGGGLEFGESLPDCLRRECMEELGRKIKISGHYYTCDDFVISEFHKEHQVIPVYYRIALSHPEKLKVHDKKPEYPAGTSEALSLRWLDFSPKNAEQFTFPTDRKVFKMLCGAV
ncbi:MAG: NUDIX domain-containing protein [Bacteroidetes bacterium]|nr:NUDIX domain-containing protein [Bacteroidota bacterium]